jgi:hypothetical protein
MSNAGSHSFHTYKAPILNKQALSSDAAEGTDQADKCYQHQSVLSAASENKF